MAKEHPDPKTTYRSDPTAEREYEAVPEVSKLELAGFDMVFATPFVEFPTAVAAVEAACVTATENGYSPLKLMGSEASLANYTAVLQAEQIKAFGSISMGSERGLDLPDGYLTYSWFESLPSDALRGKVIFFLAASSFKPPLQPAVVAAGARTYIGNVGWGMVGPSEKVFSCFWDKALTHSEEMGPALEGCVSSTHYPTKGDGGGGSFDIAGDTGLF